MQDPVPPISRPTRESQNRFRKPDKPFWKYATALFISEPRDTLEDQLYEKALCKHELWLQILHSDNVTSIEDFQTRAVEYEGIRQQEQERKSEKRISAVATNYNREKCCWRCKQRGHIRLTCQRPLKKFYLRCRKHGIFIRDCLLMSGNQPYQQRCSRCPIFSKTRITYQSRSHISVQFNASGIL